MSQSIFLKPANHRDSLRKSGHHNKSLTIFYGLQNSQLAVNKQSIDLLPYRMLALRATPSLLHCSSSSNYRIQLHSPTLASHLNKTSSRVQQVARHLTNSPSKPSEMSQLPISEKGYHSRAPAVYSVRKNGAPNTLEHRIFIEKDGVPLSPFHDIPLYANEQQTVLNMIVEIPRWTNAKMEVS